MPYTPFAWADGSEGGTPITAERLNAIEDFLGQLSDNALTAEALQFPVVLAATVSATATLPAMTALYDCTLMQASLVFRTAVAASDSAYWTIELVRYRAGSAATIASKATKVTGGEAIAAWSDWNFDTTAFDQGGAVLVKGDTVAVKATKTGTPADLDNPTATLRTAPGVVNLPTHASASGTFGWVGSAAGSSAVVSDTFTRSNSSTTLGTAETGQAWTVKAGTWGINSGRAYCVSSSSTSTRSYAYVEAGVPDCIVRATMLGVTTGAGSEGICFRMSGEEVGWLLTPSTGGDMQLFKCTAVGLISSVATFTGAGYVAGDVIEVELAGSLMTFRKNGVTVGTYTDSFNAGATKHGLRVTTSGRASATSQVFDDFKVFA